MRPENTLRRRLLLAFVLLAAAIGGAFAGAAYLIIEATEYQLIDLRLARVAAALEQDLFTGAGRLAGVAVAVGAQIPQELHQLAPGHHEVDLQGREMHVLIGNYGGQRYALIEDSSDFEQIERLAYVGLGAAFLAGVVLALAIARAAANRVIAPLTALASSVQRDDLKEQPRLLNAVDEIGVLARAFDARASQLRNVLLRERLFTADVSHELRTPLTVMLGAAELLSARLAPQAELRTVAERIRRTAADTSVRVSALLQLARAPETIESTRFSLRDLVEQEMERCRPLLDGKPVALTLESPGNVWVHAAHDLAAIAVGNLLRNACYFTQRGAVRVVLGASGLVIEDTGPGVPAQVRDRILAHWVQGHAEPPAGTGLGLSIVKRVAEHLGWAVRLENIPQGGSRFTLIFPAQVSAPSPFDSVLAD
jgi:signal transduction histidine kinase